MRRSWRRRLGVLLRRARREHRAPIAGRRDVDPDVRVGHARLHQLCQRARRRLPRGQRLPLGSSQLRDLQLDRHLQPRRSHRSPDPEHRRARAGSAGRDAAATQSGGPLPSAGATTPCRQPRAQRDEHLRNGPIYPDPRQLRRHRLCTNRPVPRIRIQLLAPRFRRLRRAEPGLAGPPCGAAGGERQTDRGPAIWSLLRLQRGDDDRHDQQRWPVLLAARHDPGGQRAPAVRNDAAQRTEKLSGCSGASARARPCAGPGGPGAGLIASSRTRSRRRRHCRRPRRRVRALSRRRNRSSCRSCSRHRCSRSCPRPCRRRRVRRRRAAPRP